jgi:hypothetical protein
MNDLKQDLQELFREKARSVDTSPVAHEAVLRRGRRRQVRTVLSGAMLTVATIAIALAAIGRQSGIPSTTIPAAGVTPTGSAISSAGGSPAPGEPLSFPSTAVEVASIERAGQTVKLFIWREGTSGFCVGIVPDRDAACDVTGASTPTSVFVPMAAISRLDPAGRDVIVFGSVAPDIRSVRITWEGGSVSEGTTSPGPAPFDDQRFFLWATRGPLPVSEATFEFLDANGHVVPDEGVVVPTP